MVDFKIEVVVLPVSDVDRAKEFYGRLGFREDVDYSGPGGFRVVHFTRPARPPRSSSGPESPTRRPAPRRACT